MHSGGRGHVENTVGLKPQVQDVGPSFFVRRVSDGKCAGHPKGGHGVDARHGQELLRWWRSMRLRVLPRPGQMHPALDDG